MSASYETPSLERPSQCCESARDAGLLLIRLALAGVFIFHGAQKLFGWFEGKGIDTTAQMFAKMGLPMPWHGAVAAGSAEFFGGILLLLGLFTRFAAFAMAFTMAVATWTHLPKGYSLAKGGAEYALTLGIVLLAVALMGPGRWSLGHAIWGGRRAIRDRSR